MDISTFATRFGVQSDVHFLVHYVVAASSSTVGTAQRLIRSRWAITFLCPDERPHAQRVLVLDHDTDHQTSEEDIDAFEVLASEIVDSRDAGGSFEDYVAEWGSEVQLDKPVKHAVTDLYARWRAHADLRHRITEWCATDEMRAALGDVERD